MSQYRYGDVFFAYQQIGSLQSARAVVPVLLRRLPVASVLDVGCGAGAWLSAYLDAGIADVSGVDGAWLPREQLLVDRSRVRAVDVAGRFRLARPFDLVQCLEVAEHVPPPASATLVDNLVAHAGVVLFSAAPPGQGGEHHVNERPYEFWRALFDQRGYDAFDFVRPRLQGLAQVEPWYRYNPLLYVRRDLAAQLHPEVAATAVPRGTPIADVSPLPFRVRKRVLSQLPEPLVTRLAVLKHRLLLRRLAAS